MPDDFVRVAAEADLQEGTMLAIHIGEDEEICLARAGGIVYAIDNVCTHLYTWLSDGWLQPESLTVQCPLHESCFDLRTGAPTAPPADVPVAIYPVRLADGQIFVGPARASHT